MRRTGTRILDLKKTEVICFESLDHDKNCSRSEPLWQFLTTVPDGPVRRLVETRGGLTLDTFHMDGDPY